MISEWVFSNTPPTPSREGRLWMFLKVNEYGFEGCDIGRTESADA